MPAPKSEIINMQEVILQVGVDGGDLTLYGSRTAGGWQFSLGVHDCTPLLVDEGDPAIRHTSSRVTSWADAITLLDTYPHWAEFYPLAVHPDFRKQVWEEVERRLHHAGRDQHTLDQWRTVCEASLSPAPSGGFIMATPISVDTPKLTKGIVVSLQSLGIDEAYLEKFIGDDPTVLGLGEVSVLQHQRRQEKAGRLDLLLEDDSEEVRYEVELMLGKADESHMIRTIEYWDIERRLYPAYDHRAVLIAENITTRFLNVITLFSGSIPLIAIQMNAIKVGDKTGITFVQVVDITKLRKDDKTIMAKAKPTDRNEWVSRVGTDMVEMADKCLAFINEAAKRPRKLNYTKKYIGLTDGGQVNNFVVFFPTKSILKISIEIEPVDPWVGRLKGMGLDFENRQEKLQVSLTAKDFEENRDFVREILREAVIEDEEE